MTDTSRHLRRVANAIATARIRADRKAEQVSQERKPHIRIPSVEGAINPPREVVTDPDGSERPNG